jgi:Mrp family chromosome partitioning ATPase
MELLSSQRMADLLQKLRKMYDYVILDLPPVGEVGDALAVAKQTDGMLLVCRQNYCNRGALADAIAQFEFMNAKILGIVFNCTTEQTAGYGKHYGKKYYKKYHKRYYKSYEGAYKAAGKSGENEKKIV